MKILFYNWARYDDCIGRGGGVTVYLHNLIEHFSEEPDIECVFLCSGVEYTFDKKLRIEEIEAEYSPRVRAFQILNSPVHAPAATQSANLEVYLYDNSLYHVLEDFLESQGKIDVIHFHNLEGLSLPVLQLKKRFPETKFVFTIHNYYSFCPQVNLWAKDCNCYIHSLFPACDDCLDKCNMQTEEFISSVKNALRKDGKSENTAQPKALKKAANVFRGWFRFLGKRIAFKKNGQVDHQSLYTEFRKASVQTINQYMDCILAVSERTADIARDYGILPEKLRTSYIGTKAATIRQPPHVVHGDHLRIAYLGYARKDKGFFFFLQALKTLPRDTAGKLDVLLAAKCGENEFLSIKKEIDAFADHFYNITFLNGFKKTEQAQILSQIDLGVIPSQWEDNLPQVAIEYVANGVPILTSDLGGARELCPSPLFVFKSENEKSLIDALAHFADKPKLLETFWSKEPLLVTMEQHIDELRQLYTE